MYSKYHTHNNIICSLPTPPGPPPPPPPHTHTHRLSEEAKKLVAEWDLSPSSDEFDLNIEGEDQTLQHVPIEDWGCTLSDENN